MSKHRPTSNGHHAAVPKFAGAAVPEIDFAFNDTVHEALGEMFDAPDLMGVEIHEVGGANVVDCGVQARGGLWAGRMLAEACLGSAAIVNVAPDRLGGVPCPRVNVEMEWPYGPCLLSQYAGTKLDEKGYFAMCSGPIRAAIGAEGLFAEFDYREEAEVAVAALEAAALPPAAVVRKLAKQADVEPEALTVLVARTASVAGLHKLHALKFDVRTIRSATGSAYLPPVPRKDLEALGRANDSILLGGEVCLWVEADDDTLRDVGARLPAAASRDYGKPFAEIFAAAGQDFYKIDPLLFSPALVVVNNLASGSTFVFGRTDHDLLKKSFFGA
jgi:methenyltetrahydromethanopterin cyclohydrolase